MGGYTHGTPAKERALNTIDARLQRLRDKMASGGLDQDAAEVLKDAIGANTEAHRKIALMDNLIQSAGNLMVLYMPKQEIKMNVGLVANLHVEFHEVATQESIGQVIEALKFQQRLFPKESDAATKTTPADLIKELHTEADKIRNEA